MPISTATIVKVGVPVLLALGTAGWRVAGVYYELVHRVMHLEEEVGECWTSQEMELFSRDLRDVGIYTDVQSVMYD